MAKTKRKTGGRGIDPHSGGITIQTAVRERTKRRILAHAEKYYQGKFLRLDIRFRGALCYIDAYQEPNLPPGWPPKSDKISRKEYLERLRNTPVHLCRLRYFGEDQWSLAFFTYSNEQYTPSVFKTGSFFGTPEEAFDIGAMYLE